MKTQMNTRNFKNLSAVVLVSLLVALSSYTRASEGDTSNSKSVVSARLEAMMDKTAQSLRYVAPRNIEPEYTSVEIQRLDNLAARIEESLKYDAHAFTEAEEVAAAMDRLDKFADAVVASARYIAPAVEESVAFTTEQERLDAYFAQVETTLKYRAPAIVNQSNDLNGNATDTESILADLNK